MSIELDYMESYTTDALAQSNYPSSDTGADANTVLLANLDGADGATSFTAETGQVATFVGDAQLDTAQYKFGTASLLLDGTGDCITFPDNVNWYIYDGYFALDCQLRFATEAVFCLCGQYVDGSNFWGFYYSNPNLILYGTFSGTVKFYYTGTLPSLSVDTWHHIAVVRSGSTCYMFADGVSLSITVNTAFTASADLAATFDIGRYANTYTSACWIDEFRVSKGTARWTSNFTPPIRAYDLDKLIAYSEPTIKTQGSYSLNGFAAQTGSLNDTLTRTISPTIDLTGQTSWKFDIRSSRTGSNIKIGIRDSGLTVTETTPNIISENTWQTVTVDISGVSDANKDAIDRLIITPTNADEDNTFYTDNMYAEIVSAVGRSFGIVIM